jgi:peptide/nickel transport system substrate-binding protein
VHYGTLRQFEPGKPLTIVCSTRAIPSYVDMSTFVIDQFKQVGVVATLEQVESAQWYAKLTRGDYQVAPSNTGIGVDDPDAAFYENYYCGSPRNYSQYCNQDVDRLIDPQRRRAIVDDIQRRLADDGARPILGWGLDYFAMWPYVHNLVPHNVLYNWGRLQEVWLSR